MSKKIEYKLEVPLFTDEATALWKDMPNIMKGIVAKKQDAIEKFKRLDAIVNNGELVHIGTAFGEDIYARFNANDPDHTEYLRKCLGAMMSNFMSGEPEEIQLDGKRYFVALKEEL